MILITFLMLLLGHRNGANPEILDLLGSGDGETSTLKLGPSSMVDDSGEIRVMLTSSSVQDATTPEEAEMVEVMFLSPEKTLAAVSVNFSSSMYSERNGTVSTMIPTDIPTVVPDTTESESISTDSQTTEITTETSTKIGSTTTTVTTSISTTTTPTASTTFTEEISTTTTTLKSMVSFMTIIMGENQQSTVKIPQISTTEMTFVPDVEREICTYLETELTCSEDLVCYGEGEIDCTENNDITPEKQTFIEKIHVSSISEDYSDFDAAESGTIGTFPPNLVGVVSPKKIPFLYNMKSLGTTEINDNISSEPDEEQFSVTTVGIENFTILPSDKTTLAFAEEESSDTTAVPEITEEELSTITVGGSENDFTSPSFTTIAINEEKTDNSSVITTETTGAFREITSTPLTVNTLEVSPEVGEVNINSRKKRDDIISSESDSSSSSMSMSFHMAALESPKKKLRSKVCRLSGNLVCTPTPTTAMCRGKTFCQATSSTAETSETSTKGVENWAIAVIVVCGLCGCLTVGLLIYLVVTSCKKLKVQPTHEVTTLNYINRGAGVTELA